MTDEEFHEYCKKTRIPTSFLVVLAILLSLAVVLGECYAGLS